MNTIILHSYSLKEKKRKDMKYFRNFTLPVLLMLIGTMGIKAQTVGLEEAKQKALAFVKKSNKAKALSANPSRALSLAYTSKAGDETYYYVFNNGQEGYVIIGGDEVANDVLGYSDSGTFSYDKLPDNMKWFLSCYDHQISAAIQQVKEGKISVADVAKAKRAPRKTKTNIPYMLQTTWDQVAPFNSQIPLNKQPGFTGSDALATGCVATAGAQIMKYHVWPDRGVGSHTDPYTVNGVSYSADFANTTYDWANMQNTYTPYDTYTGSAADVAVGTLMYHIGVAVDMRYGQLRSGGSEADARKLAEALVNNFKYSKGITYHGRGYYTDQQWEDMVYNELAAHRPVLYGGQQVSGSGHAFVCDGYQDGLYHINWGWSGSNDDYFLLTPTADSGSALCPSGSGSGGGAAGQGYDMSQRIGIGITPDRYGTSQPTKSAYTQFTLATTSVAPEGNITLNDYYCGNESAVAQSYNLKMKFTNTADQSDVIIGDYIRTTSELAVCFAESSTEPFKAPSRLVPGQSYYVTLMYENSQGEYVDMPQLQTIEPQVLSVTEPEPTGMVLQELFVDNGGYITMNSFNFKAKVKNYTSNNWTKTYLKCKITFGSQIVDFYSEPFKFFSGEEAIVTFDISNSQNGSYLSYYFGIGDRITTCVEDYDGNVISDPITFQFCNELPLSYTLTSAGWGTLCLPYSAKVPTGLTAYTVTSTDGDNLVKEEVTTLEYNKPYLITGTPGTYPFNGPDTPEAENLKNGLLVGNTTAAQTYAPQDSYVLQNLPARDGLAFYQVAADGTQKVRQYGAYLKTDDPLAKSFRFIDEESTGITATPNDRTTDTPAHNLNGMRVNRNAKGFVIVNGKLIYNR